MVKQFFVRSNVQCEIPPKAVAQTQQNGVPSNV